VSILDRITEKKKERLAWVKGKVPPGDLKAKIAGAEVPRDFRGAVRSGNGRIRLIAELKQASPSKGAIRAAFDPKGIARTYEEKAVDAISVLTEEDFFYGDLKYIPAVKSVVTKPLLRKDFIFDEYQIHESRAWGADAILLIASLLGRDQAVEYLALARELGLAVLFEVHSFDELEKALRVDAEIIGINNRDLSTLTVDLNTTFLLKKEIPPDRIVVSESGINTAEDVERLAAAGVDAILVGTALMEADDIGKKIDELMGSRTI
jgi:indole-3-glycerol phosphate synthase